MTQDVGPKKKVDQQEYPAAKLRATPNVMATVDTSSAHASGQPGKDRGVVDLIDRLRGASSVHPTDEVVTSLGSALLPTVAEVPDLILLLHDPDPSVRCEAALKLSQIGPEATEACPALVSLLNESNKDVLRRALWAFLKIGSVPTTAIPTLTALMQHEDPELRGRATLALGRVGPETATAIKVLLAVLEDNDSYVRGCAATALGDIGPSAAVAVEALIDHLKNDESVRNRVAAAIGGIGPAAAAAVPALLKHLRDNVTIWPIMSLGNIGPAAVSSVPDLVKVLRDDYDPHVRAAAASALARISPTGSSAIAAIIASLDDEWAPVREAAKEGLNRSREALEQLEAGNEQEKRDVLLAQTQKKVNNELETTCESALPSPVDKLQAELTEPLKGLAGKLPPRPEDKARVAADLNETWNEAFWQELRQDLRSAIKDLLRDVPRDYEGKQVRTSLINKLLDALHLSIAFKDGEGRVHECTIHPSRARDTDPGRLRLRARRVVHGVRGNFPVPPVDQIEITDATQTTPDKEHGKNRDSEEPARGK